MSKALKQAAEAAERRLSDVGPAGYESVLRSLETDVLFQVWRSYATAGTLYGAGRVLRDAASAILAERRDVEPWPIIAEAAEARVARAFLFHARQHFMKATGRAASGGLVTLTVHPICRTRAITLYGKVQEAYGHDKADR